MVSLTNYFANGTLFKGFQYLTKNYTLNCVKSLCITCTFYSPGDVGDGFGQIHVLMPHFKFHFCQYPMRLQSKTLKHFVYSCTGCSFDKEHEGEPDNGCYWRWS